MTEDRTPYQSARPHSWGPSRLGHGTSMCSRCFVTDAEAAALGELNDCSQWEEPAPVEAEKTKKTEEHARADSARWVEHIAEIEARGLGRDAKDLDRLRAENERLTAERDALREALKSYYPQLCEGWCDDAPVVHEDCAGCVARAALALGDQS